MSVEEDHCHFIQESGEYETTVRRLALYYQVVKVLVPGHGITDDDPERAVVEALDRIEQLGLARYGVEPIDDELPNLEDRARELAEEVPA